MYRLSWKNENYWYKIKELVYLPSFKLHFFSGSDLGLITLFGFVSSKKTTSDGGLDKKVLPTFQYNFGVFQNPRIFLSVQAGC